MGQATGGNAGNLELLKKIEEQRAEIEELKAITEKSTGICIKVSEKVTLGDGANKWQKTSRICALQYDFSVGTALSGVVDILRSLPSPKENYWVKLCADTSTGATSEDALVMIKTKGNEGYMSSNWRDVKPGRYMGTIVYMTAV